MEPTVADGLRQRLTEAIDEAFTSEADFDAGKAADAALAVVEDEALDRMAEHFINETKIRSMDFRNGMSMNLEPARELAAVWVGCARGMLGDAPNYSETSVTFTVSLAGEAERYAFTLQRVGRLTPHEARQQAERELDEWRERAEKAEAAIARVRNLANVYEVNARTIDGVAGRNFFELFTEELRAALDPPRDLPPEDTTDVGH